MSKIGPGDSNSPEANGSRINAAMSSKGISPYATGGGGVTFERKVAVQYLAHLLTGDNARELGDGRYVISVAFQQAPHFPNDDLIVKAKCSDESQPSLVLELAVRRSPKIVKSNAATRKLIQQFIHAVMKMPEGDLEHRLGLVVSGAQKHAQQLAQLAQLAAHQMNASDFFDLVQTPNKFDSGIRSRLDHLEKLVQQVLDNLGKDKTNTQHVKKITWQLLSRLTVLMPRLESPDDTDWSSVANNLTRCVQDSNLSAASQLRDRLVSLAGEYSPNAAQVNLAILRRDSHALLNPTMRRHYRDWQKLGDIHQWACNSVRDKIVSGDDLRSTRLERNTEAMELIKIASNSKAVIVSGESGVGKSALAVLEIAAVVNEKPDRLQMLCINLRQIPKLAITFEEKLGYPLSTLLCELSAPQRMLVIDGADAVTEGYQHTFRYLISAAQDSDVKVIAVTSDDSKQVVLDILSEKFGTSIGKYVVSPLSNSEIDEIVKTFSELAPLNANPKSRELLRRLVVVDLLIRGQVSGTPMTDADAMNEVWSGLVRRRKMPDRGYPDAREIALLKLAELEFSESKRLDVISEIDSVALDGLRRDGLLRTSPETPFKIGPEFTHDEVRRYAVARLLLDGDNPALRLIQWKAPRWSLTAARLACQAWLDQSDTRTLPLKGRFSALQKSFSLLVDEGHGSRWSDVPGEALLKLANPKELLRDAWPSLLAENAAGLKRLARLVEQRLCDDKGIVDVTAVEPIITILLEDPTPWRSGQYAEDLLRAWLRGHVMRQTTQGHTLRILLRQRLVATCEMADRHFTEKCDATTATRAKRMLEEGNHVSKINCDGQKSQRRPTIPRALKDRVVLELLALLGPDLGCDGEAILCRIAKETPAWLGPVVDDLFTSKAIAGGRRGLLAELTEAYYLDDEVDVAGRGVFENGVRRHLHRSILSPHAAWHCGPFMSLLQSDFRNGVRVLNRLLNHATRVRTHTLTHRHQGNQPFVPDIASPYESEFQITGARQLYVGDGHVWRWYRGTAVGPYPCFSALQALERVCDQRIKAGVPIKELIPILLDDCESLAMIGLIVGILVRHLEDAGDLLDPYLTEPLIWRQEFKRVATEGGDAASSEELVAPERRNWSLREAAIFMGVKANSQRATELQTLGKTLISNARHLTKPVPDCEPAQSESVTRLDEQLIVQVRAWASNLDQDRYRIQKVEGGFHIETEQPDDVTQALKDDHEEMERSKEAMELMVRYLIEPRKGLSKTRSHDELVADIATARRLIECPPSRCVHEPWDTCALVAATTLEAHLVDRVRLPDDTLSFTVEILLRIGEKEAGSQQRKFAETFFEAGANRSAARVLPLLLLPVAEPLRAMLDEKHEVRTLKRTIDSCINLARAVEDEVRLHLARGLDHVWETPCVEHGRCHHELGWKIITETLYCCIFRTGTSLSAWRARKIVTDMLHRCILSISNLNTRQRRSFAPKEQITKSLVSAAEHSIQVSQLDAAIRALAPAGMANICISTPAKELLLVLLAAQRRSLLACDAENSDYRRSHTLVSARALLTLAQNDDYAPIYEQIDAYADHPALLGNLLCSLSAAAEETPSRAKTARRIWPKVVHHVLQLNQSGRTQFQRTTYGDFALSSLIPNITGEIPYLYREINKSPLKWWNPLELKSEVEAWLALAAGNGECVDQLIGFIRELKPDEQIRVGLPWIAKLVEAAPNHIAQRTYTLETWLIKTRDTAADAGLLPIWQRITDALVVEGATRLAPYSD